MRVGRLIVTAVAEMKAPRSMAATRAAMIAGAWSKPNEAGLTRVSQRAAANASLSPADSPRSPPVGSAPLSATMRAAASLRARATHWCPRRAASASTYPPRKPLPPVISRLIAAPRADRWP